MRIAVHGGAGALRPGGRDPAEEAALRADLAAAAAAGWQILAAGGASVDAVTEAVRLLEDSPHFNAGRGSVLTIDGEVEMDAAIMRGTDAAAGAVAVVRTVRNPVLAARAVMEHSEHVVLAGPGAEAFARARGLEFRDAAWFLTERRRQSLERHRAHLQSAVPPVRPADFSTVGAVALDGRGHLAAATSTGGMTGKHPGRIGDTAVIGAGTWADELCAVSVTGWGEYCIRASVAHEVAARLRLAGQGIGDAARIVMLERVPELGGSGGLIALDRQGRLAMPFSTEGMARAQTADGRVTVQLFADD